MDCRKSNVVEEIAKIMAEAIIRKNMEKSLAIQSKRSDNCKNSEEKSKNYVK